MSHRFDKLSQKFSSRWLPYTLIILASIAAAIFFLWKNPHEVPMGDAYVHFKYARNLAAHGVLSFNGGADEGIGTSSILWVVILAIFQRLGLSPVAASKILGVGFSIASGILIFELSQQLIPSQPKNKRYRISAAVAIIGMASGSMVWISLSGMETILFLCLGLLAIWLYTRQSWILLGITLGLMTLTRIEGITLAGIIGVVELLRARRINRALVMIFTPLVLILAPWLIYLQLREGVPISTSFLGRRFVLSAVEERISNQFPLLSFAQKINPLVHIACWTYFTFVFISGSIALPGPVLNLGGSLVGTELTIPVAAIFVLCLCLPLLRLSFKRFFDIKPPAMLSNPESRLKLILIAWLLLINLAYALFLPHPGSAGRYIPMNHIIFWISLLVGSLLIQKRPVQGIAMILVFSLFGINLKYWQGVYQANIDYMVNVRKAAAVFIDQQVPLEMPVGATDLGAMGYYARQPVVDLFGFVNKEASQLNTHGGEISDFVAAQHLCYLVLFDSADGAGLNFAEEMRLIDDPRFNLSLEKSFSVSAKDWSLGNGPVRNYMPVMNIYHVQWLEHSSCPWN